MSGEGYVITAKAITALGVIGESAGVILEVISPTRPTMNPPYDWPIGTNYGSHILQARAFDLSQVEARATDVQFEIIQPPLVSMASPLTGSSVYLTLPVNLTATVTRGTYSITEVRYLINDTPRATLTTPPYALQWTPSATAPTQCEFRCLILAASVPFLNPSQ